MPRIRSKDRLKNEVNAGSMADIAFLLLIFFLVATTIAQDKGLLVKLPPWSNEPVEDVKLNKRNVFSVLVNAKNQLLVRDEPTDIRDLRRRAIEFITNPQHREDLSVNPQKAVISLKNDRGTNYETYLTVYNELLGAYNEIWEVEAQKRFGKSYQKLPKHLRKQIRKDFPMVISEAEPTEYGEEK